MKYDRGYIVLIRVYASEAECMHPLLQDATNNYGQF